MTSHLANSTDDELIAGVKNGNSEAFVEVCKKYENIFFKICQRYVPALTVSGIHPQDIFDEKDCTILECVKTFDPSKNTKLSTHIGNYARYLCLNRINANRFFEPTLDGDISSIIEANQAKQIFNENQDKKQEILKYIFVILNQIKDQRIKTIFELRYLGHKKMIWTEIAKKMGISTQTAINLHSRGLNLIKKKLTSNTISDCV